MPEETSGNFIGSCVYIKDNTDTLIFFCAGLLHFQYNGRTEILVAQIGKFIIFPDIYHTAQIFDQATVRVISSSLVKEAAAVCIGIKDQLQCVNNRRLSAS